MSVRSLRCAAAPPFPTVLWKEVAVHTPHPRRRDAPLPSPRMECLQNHVDSPAEQIPSSPVSLSITHLCPFAPMGVYFILRAMIQYDFVLLLNRLQLWSLAAPSVGSAVPRTHPSMEAVVFCFRALSSLSGTRCSRLIPGISCSCPRVGVSPGSPAPFRWKWCEKPRSGRWCADRGCGVLLLGPLS